MTADDWRVWILALHRPQRVDDEEIPAEVERVTRDSSRCS
jgi:hypothetical protein